MWNAMSDQMIWGCNDEQSRPFRHFQFAAGADGAMWVRPGGHRLDDKQVLGLIALMGDAGRRGAEQDIVLHVDDLRAISGAWGLFSGGLLDFTRRVGVPCRIVSLASRSAIVPSLRSETDTAAGPALHECQVSTHPSGV
jgi:hypothetical protein